MREMYFYYLIEFKDGDGRGIVCLEPYRIIDSGVTFLPEDHVSGQYVFIPNSSLKSVQPVTEEVYNETMDEEIEEPDDEDGYTNLDDNDMVIPRGLIPGI